MKFTIVALATVGLVTAQSISDIPACAQTCLLPALQKTGCDLTDFKCSCSNSAFVSGSSACIQTACSAADVVKAAQATYLLCKSVGVTIPTAAVSSPATSAAASSSVAPASSAPVSSAPASSAAASTSETPVSSAAPLSSYASAPTTAVTTKAVVTMTTTTSICTTSTQAASNGTATVPSPPIATGGAGNIAASMALAVGGAVVAFFL